jgi:hypothetical protein
MKPLLVEMENKDRQHKMVDMIKKIVSIHKPEGVVDVEVEVEPSSSDGVDFYYLSLTYIVPSDSEFLTIGKLHMKNEWNKEIRRSIEDFLNIKVFLRNSRIKSVNSELKPY